LILCSFFIGDIIVEVFIKISQKITRINPVCVTGDLCFVL
jgi:hypothetical protein